MQELVRWTSLGLAGESGWLCVREARWDSGQVGVCAGQVGTRPRAWRRGRGRASARFRGRASAAFREEEKRGGGDGRVWGGEGGGGHARPLVSR
eukprot:664426-Pleurochrysis_carterae.AAC.1